MNNTVGNDAISLLELNRKTRTGADLNTILDAINKQACKLMDAKRSTIYVYDHEKKEVWSKVALDLEIPEIRLPLGVGIAGTVAEKREVINIQDAYSDPRFFPDYDKLTNFRTKSILVAPLINTENELIGVIQVLNKNNGNFNKNDEETILILAKLAAIAIDQHLLQHINHVMREYIQNVIENIVSAIIVLEKDFRIGLINNSAKNLFKLDEKSILGQYCHQVLYFIDDLPNYLEQIKHKSMFEIEKLPVVYNNNTDLSFINLKITQFNLSDNNELGYILIIDDVSEKVHLERENKRKEHLTLIGNMLSNVIHDLKNPMSTIKGYIHLLKRKLSEDQKHFRYIDTIENEVDHMNGMIREILDYARGETSLQFQTFVFKEFLEHFFETIKNDFANQGIELNLKCDYEGKIKADSNKIARLIYNISDNARDAMPKGGTFTVQVKRRDDVLFITMKDTGIGMPQSVRHKIFEPFFSFGKSSGTGLGMAIVRKIIDEHNGVINVSSTENQGTTFYIELPICVGQ